MFRKIYHSLVNYTLPALILGGGMACSDPAPVQDQRLEDVVEDHYDSGRVDQGSPDLEHEHDIDMYNPEDIVDLGRPDLTLQETSETGLDVTYDESDVTENVFDPLNPFSNPACNFIENEGYRLTVHPNQNVDENGEGVIPGGFYENLDAGEVFNSMETPSSLWHPISHASSAIINGKFFVIADNGDQRNESMLIEDGEGSYSLHYLAGSPDGGIANNCGFEDMNNDNSIDVVCNGWMFYGPLDRQKTAEEGYAFEDPEQWINIFAAEQIFHSMYIADFDLDGRNDIHISGREQGRIMPIYCQDGTGNFYDLAGELGVTFPEGSYSFYHLFVPWGVRVVFQRHSEGGWPNAAYVRNIDGSGNVSFELLESPLVTDFLGEDHPFPYDCDDFAFSRLFSLRNNTGDDGRPSPNGFNHTPMGTTGFIILGPDGEENQVQFYTTIGTAPRVMSFSDDRWYAPGENLGDGFRNHIPLDEEPPRILDRNGNPITGWSIMTTYVDGGISPQIVVANSGIYEGEGDSEFSSNPEDMTGFLTFYMPNEDGLYQRLMSEEVGLGNNINLNGATLEAVRYNDELCLLVGQYEAGIRAICYDDNDQRNGNRLFIQATGLPHLTHIYALAEGSEENSPNGFVVGSDREIRGGNNLVHQLGVGYNDTIDLRVVIPSSVLPLNTRSERSRSSSRVQDYEFFCPDISVSDLGTLEVRRSNPPSYNTLEVAVNGIDTYNCERM